MFLLYDRYMDHHHLEALYPESTRFEEIKELLSFIKDGKSAQLIGMPGVGRGNLCAFLVYNHNIRVRHLGQEQTKFHFVFINFAEVKNRPLGDVLKFIFLELVSSLHERRLEDAFTQTDAIFKKSLSYKDDLVLFQGLKDAVDILVHEKNLHIIFMFERFELYIPLLTDDFFVHIRSLRERAKYKFSVVFSLTRPLEDFVEPATLADFYEFFAGNTVYTKVYDSIGTAFRISYLQQLAQKKLPEKTIQTLIDITGGHGKLVRLGCEALLATSDKIPETKQELLAFLLPQKTIQGALREIWAFLIPSEQQALKDCVQSKSCKIETDVLEKLGLLDSSHTITIPLFTEYVKAHTSQDKQTLTYDPSTDTIKKGSLVLSEQLTGAEFRLLKYLLENSHTILTRETIITAVWKETATTAGVTDQALDQLIFRVRKKIEEDPNNPTHLLTIKGRGIKFTL